MNAAGTLSRPPFDSAILRRLAWLSWGFPILWFGGSAVAGKVFALDSMIAFSLKYCLLPLWLMLACHAAYYLHLLAWRLGLNRRILATTLVTASVAFMLLAGFEAGLTATLCFAAVLGFAITWSMSVAVLLGLQSGAARWAMVSFGMAIPPCAAAFALATSYYIMTNEHNDSEQNGVCIAVMIGSALVLLAGMILSWMARMAARQIVAAAAP